MVVRGAAGPVLLHATGLIRSFGSVLAVRDLDLAVVAGSVHALVGPSGSGKTTVLNLLSGYLVPDSGEVLVDGRDVSGLDPQRLRSLGIERCFAIADLFDAVPAEDYVRLMLDRSRAAAALARAGLAARGSAELGSLGVGPRRALELALTLASDPRLVILDEPSAGLSPPEVDRLAELLAPACQGSAVLLAEHNLRLVAALADTVSVLRAGQVVAQGSHAEVRREALLAAYHDP